MQRAWNAYTQDPNDKIIISYKTMNRTMKKSYVAPTMEVVSVLMAQMISASKGISSNVEFEYGGETPDDFIIR